MVPGAKKVPQQRYYFTSSMLGPVNRLVLCRPLIIDNLPILHDRPMVHTRDRETVTQVKKGIVFTIEIR